MNQDNLIAELALHRKNPAGMAAFSQLLAEVWDEGTTVARTIVQNDADADDVMQLVAIKLLDTIDAFDPKKGFSNWFFWTVKKQALDFRRARKTRAKHAVTGYNLDELHGASPSAVLQIERDEFLARFWAFANTLNDKNYAVLKLVVVQGRSFSEASAALGVGRSMIQKRMEKYIRPALVDAVGLLPEDTSFTLERRAEPRETDEYSVKAA